MTDDTARSQPAPGDATASPTSRAIRGGLIVMGVIATALTIATARAVLEGESHVTLADAAIRHQDFASAITEARAGAVWYVPAAPHVAAAYRRLEHVARVSEAQNDPATALDAWRAERGAALETRWLLQTHRAEIDAADSAIARLTVPPPPKDGGAPTPPPVRAAPSPELLAESRSPWLLVLTGSLISMLVGSFVAAAKFDGARPSRRIEAIQLPLGFVLVGLALFLLAAWRA